MVLLPKGLLALPISLNYSSHRKTQQDLGVHIKCRFNFQSSKEATFCDINTVFFRCCEIMWIPSFILQSEEVCALLNKKRTFRSCAISSKDSTYNRFLNDTYLDMKTKCNSQCLWCARRCNNVCMTDWWTLWLHWTDISVVCTLCGAFIVLHTRTAHCSLEIICWIYRPPWQMLSSFSQD